MGMRWLKPSKWMGRGALAIVFVGSSVFAQGAGESTAAKPATADGEVKFQKTSQLSAQEQMAQSETYLARMKSELKKVDKLASRARSEKDLIKLNCVNDKVIQIKGNMRLAEQTRDALKTASVRADEGARSHEFAKLTIIHQKVTVLGQEAEACIGEEIAYVGKTRVDIQVDSEIPDEDPTVTPPRPLPTIRPPIASPFL